MRYRSGTISISEQEDLPILRTVYRAGHLTGPQLYESLHPTGLTKNRWDSFRWRLRRLAAHAFVDQSRLSGVKGDVLSLGENGELLLQGKEVTVVERACRTTGGRSRNQLWHDIELFGIQLALRRAGVVLSWKHETEIRAENDFTTFGYRKDYDAVVTFRCGERIATVALEYERTAKSSREYERICLEINRETKVAAFLYLAPSLHLKSFLLHALRSTTRRTYVALSPEFCRDPLHAELTDARLRLTQRLEDYLQDAG